MARSWWGWMAGRSSNLSRRRPPTRRRPLLVEVLESRLVPSAVQARPAYVRFDGGGGGGVSPHGSPGPTGYTPAQLQHAYGFDQITFNNGTVAADGSGQTIAIVDAYDDPRLVSSTSSGFGSSDLHNFDAAFNLPDPAFTKLDEHGGTSYPAANSGWISEIALDVEWAHAIAPKAGVVLVEAASASFTDLLQAVRTAAAQPGVVAISMSWGGGEFSGESSYDSNFQAAGVTYVAAAGDSGAPAEYPSASPYVLSVGGTTLNLDANNNISSETAWSSSGGGVSSQEAEPGYQTGVVPASMTTTRRATPDVAYDADPNTGVPVYDTYNNSTSAPWSQFGGTSIAAPQWAALIAIADQGRALGGQGSLTGSTQTLPMLYGLLADFHDITSGSSTGSPPESAGPGYDLVTGVGSPIANKLIANLSGQSSTPAATHFAVSAGSGSVAGNSITVTVTAEDASNNPVPTYNGTVHFTSSDAQAVLPGNFTFPGNTATESFSVTLKTAGNDTVTVTDTTSGITGGATVAVTPAAASQVVFVQQPPNGVVSEVLTPAVTVKVADAYGNVRNGDPVTVSLSPSSGNLGGTLTQTVSGGVATFGDLTVGLAGTYTLTAASGGVTSAPSNAFSITAPAVTHFVVTVPTTAVTAGSSFQVTVTAQDAGNQPVPGYTGTVHFTSSDNQAVLPGDFTFPGNTASATFSVTLKTAGGDTVTVADTSQPSVTGSGSVTVTAAAASQVVFVQQPSNATAGAVISPAVTVKVADAYGNVRNGDQVTVSLTGNPSGVTLGGTLTQTVSGGVATFNNLTVSAAGTYTLTATSGNLSQASGSFTVAAASTGAVVEDFETSHTWNIVNGTSPTASRTTAAAHDGTYGLDSASGNDWYYRSDAAAQVQAGDTLSVWMKFTYASSTRAYFAFGANSYGTLSLVAAPNTGQFIIQENWSYGFTNLAAVSQSYWSNHWYRLEVDWGTSGTIVGKLFDSNGTTLLRTVTAATTDITSGGFGFRNIGYHTYWDTVTVAHGVNSFALPPGSAPGGSLAPRAGGTVPVGSPAPAGRSPLERLFAADTVALEGLLQYLSRKAGPQAVAGGWEDFFRLLEGVE